MDVQLLPHPLKKLEILWLSRWRGFITLHYVNLQNTLRLHKICLCINLTELWEWMIHIHTHWLLC